MNKHIDDIYVSAGPKPKKGAEKFVAGIGSLEAAKLRI